jgi:hypothetical protein
MNSWINDRIVFTLSHLRIWCPPKHWILLPNSQAPLAKSWITSPPFINTKCNNGDTQQRNNLNQRVSKILSFQPLVPETKKKTIDAACPQYAEQHLKRSRLSIISAWSIKTSLRLTKYPCSIWWGLAASDLGPDTFERRFYTFHQVVHFIPWFSLTWRAVRFWWFGPRKVSEANVLDILISWGWGYRTTSWQIVRDDGMTIFRDDLPKMVWAHNTFGPGEFSERVCCQIRDVE